MACFYSGYLFLNKSPKKAAGLGIVVHILQLFSFTAAGWSYYFVTGFGLSLDYLFGEGSFGITAGISEFEWLLVPKQSPVEIGFNVWALIILIILDRIRRSYS